MLRFWRRTKCKFLMGYFGEHYLSSSNLLLKSFKSIRLFFLQQGMYLRDVLDDLNRRKLRDVLDFEWKRNIRFYGTDNSQTHGELIHCQDNI